MPNETAGPVKRDRRSLSPARHKPLLLLFEQQLVDRLFKIGLAHRSLSDLRPSVRRTEQQRGNRTDAENGRQFLLFLGIDLVNVDLPVLLFRQFFQNRRDHLARAAPARIEIDDTRLVAQELPLFRGRLVIGHFGQKLGFGQMPYSHFLLCFSCLLVSVLRFAAPARDKQYGGQSGDPKIFHYTMIYCFQLSFPTRPKPHIPTVANG